MGESRHTDPPSVGDVAWMAAAVLLWALAPIAMRLATTWWLRRYF